MSGSHDAVLECRVALLPVSLLPVSLPVHYSRCHFFNGLVETRNGQ